MPTYADPVIQKYIDLIKANTGVFAVFYQGEPIRISVSHLPCCIISKRETLAAPHTNAEDVHSIGITLTVITDLRKELSTENSAASAVAGIANLYDIVEGRNADYTLKRTSILDILRSNPVVDATYGLRTDLGTITRVDYGQTLRDRAQEEWSIEAQVNFVAHFTQNR